MLSLFVCWELSSWIAHFFYALAFNSIAIAMCSTKHLCFLRLPLVFLPDHAILLCDTCTPSIHADSIKDELDTDFLHSLISVSFSHPHISSVTTSPAPQLPLPSIREHIGSVDTRLSLVLWDSTKKTRVIDAGLELFSIWRQMREPWWHFLRCHDVEVWCRLLYSSCSFPTFPLYGWHFPNSVIIYSLLLHIVFVLLILVEL